MNEKLKKMYVSGGLMGALLKDPKQRKMAEEMLSKAKDGMSVKPYRSGGMMYENGGQNDVDPPKTAARDAFSAFQKEIEKKYPNPDSKVSLEDATQFLRLQRAANNELSAEVGDRRFEREKEIDALNRRSGAITNRMGESEQRRSQNNMLADEAAQRQYFTQEVQGRSFPPGAMMPKTEMERAQRLEMLKGIQQVKDDAEFEEYLKANEFKGFTPYDLQFVEGSDSYVEQPERFSPGALRRILKGVPINYYGKGGAAKMYRSGGMMYQNGGETDPPGRNEFGEFTRYQTDIIPSRADFEEAIKKEFVIGQGPMSNAATVEEMIGYGEMDSGDLARVRSRAEQIASDNFNREMQQAKNLPRNYDKSRIYRLEKQQGAGAAEAAIQKAYSRPDRAVQGIRDEYGDRIIEQAYVTTDNPEGRYLQAEIDAFNEVERIKREREDALLREMGLMK